MIPKCFHTVWLGDQEYFQTHFAEYRASWLRYHPTWNLIFWNQWNLPYYLFPPRLRFLLTRDYQVVVKADLVTYFLLWIYGGVYLDADMMCYRNIDPLISDLAIFSGYEDSVNIAKGIIGCEPMHPAMLQILSLGISNVFLGKDSDINDHPNRYTGPVAVTSVFRELKLHAFPKEIFYGGQYASHFGHGATANGWMKKKTTFPMKEFVDATPYNLSGWCDAGRYPRRSTPLEN